jgi:N-acetylglutamate synthase-like GNAT family acetyltransferase
MSVTSDQPLSLTLIMTKPETFLAFDPGNDDIVATGMLACNAEMTKGEVAIAVRSNYNNRGIIWELLGHVMRYAKSRGIKTIETLENPEHYAAISLEREMGFVTTSYPGDATITLVPKDLD